MASRLTVVTGASGIDIGPAVAQLGVDVADGMAVRIIDSTRHRVPHTSPDPYHRRRDETVSEVTAEHPDDLWTTGQVRLRYLPSAWQDPQTNLGIVFPHAARPIGDDLHTMSALGLDPSHRLTVQGKLHTLSPGHTYPLPIEPGDVGVQARDVLRTGGRVIVEAGAGMTFLDALAALNLSPWAPWIDDLDLWAVIDASAALQALAPGEPLDLPAAAREAVDRAGGPADARSTTTVRVAVVEGQMLIPSERGQLEDAVIITGR